VTVFLAILAPVLGLLGTVVGLVVGERRQRRTEARQQQEDFRKGEAAAYLELWRLVEESEMRLRSSLQFLSKANLAGQLTAVNQFMIRNGVYIAAADRQLVWEYLFGVYEFLRLAAQDPGVRQAVEITGVPPSLTSRVEGLTAVADRVEELRAQLETRVRAVLGAPAPERAAGEAQPSPELAQRWIDLADSLVDGDRPEDVTP
jgi:hypothetical protein